MTQNIQNSEIHWRIEVKDFVTNNYDYSTIWEMILHTEEIEDFFMKTMSQDHFNACATLCQNHPKL